MSALIARIRNSNLSGREFISDGEESAVRTSVCAEALRSKKVNRHETTDKKKRDRDRDGRERRPEVGRYYVVRELRKQRLSRRLSQIAGDGWPDEHVESNDERDEYEKSGTERPRCDAELFHQPAAKILQRDNMASPATHESAEDKGCQYRKCKEDESGIDRSVLERVHRFRRFNRRDGAPRDTPLNDVSDHQQV